MSGRLSPKPPRRKTAVDFITTVAASDSQHIDNDGYRRVHHSRREEGDYTVNDRAYSLALAKQLRDDWNDKSILGPSDATLCSEALIIAATSKRTRITLTIAAPAFLLALVVAGVVGHMV
jgi:hypothetical protein